MVVAATQPQTSQQQPTTSPSTATSDSRQSLLDGVHQETVANGGLNPLLKNDLNKDLGSIIGTISKNLPDPNSGGGDISNIASLSPEQVKKMKSDIATDLGLKSIPDVVEITFAKGPDGGSMTLGVRTSDGREIAAVEGNFTGDKVEVTETDLGLNNGELVSRNSVHDLISPVLKANQTAVDTLFDQTAVAFSREGQNIYERFPIDSPQGVALVQSLAKALGVKNDELIAGAGVSEVNGTLRPEIVVHVGKAEFTISEEGEISMSASDISELKAKFIIPR